MDIQKVIKDLKPVLVHNMEQAKKLSKYLDKAGLKWCDGDRYTEWYPDEFKKYDNADIVYSLKTSTLTDPWGVGSSRLIDFKDIKFNKIRKKAWN